MIGSLIVLIILGALVGWVASIIMKRNEQQGWLENILIGIIGAFIGGFLSRWATGSQLTGADDLSFTAVNLFWALVGALLLCAAINYAQRGRVR